MRDGPHGRGSSPQTLPRSHHPQNPTSQLTTANHHCPHVPHPAGTPPRSTARCLHLRRPASPPPDLPQAAASGSECSPHCRRGAGPREDHGSERRRRTRRASEVLALERLAPCARMVLNPRSRAPSNSVRMPSTLLHPRSNTYAGGDPAHVRHNARGFSTTCLSGWECGLD